jgi:hypothetical protein
MTDSEIEQWVLRELKFAEQSNRVKLCVSAHQGIVTLAARSPIAPVGSRPNARRSESRGVRSVVNNLCARSSRRPPDSRHVMTKTAAVGATTQSPQRARSEQTA